jgi:hypothetical protein
VAQTRREQRSIDSNVSTRRGFRPTIIGNGELTPRFPAGIGVQGLPGAVGVHGIVGVHN